MTNMLRGSLSKNVGRGVLGYKGEKGDSAYQIAVKNGYEGTEQEWIDHFGLDLSGYVQTADVVDDLTSTYTTKPLSAKQGKNLKDSVDSLSSGKVSTSDIADNLTTDSSTKVLSAKQGKTLKTAVDTTDSKIGSLSSLNTTSKTNVVSAINEVNTKYARHIITATIDGDVTLTNSSDTPITLVSANSVGTKLTISNGKIVIGAGVSKVLVSGKANFNSLTSSTSQRYFKIKKNSSEIAVCRISSPSNTNGEAFSIPPRILSVEENDTIGASVQGVSGDVLRETETWTYVTVEVIE